MQTFLIILEQSFRYLPLVCGAYVSIALLKVPDLSIEAAYVFGAITASQGIMWFGGVTTFAGCMCIALISLLGGLAVGCISGCLTYYARLPHLLSSILTIGMFHGMNQFVLGSANVSLSGLSTLPDYFDIGGQFGELPLLTFLFLLLTVGGLYFLRTQLGMALAVHGNNPYFFSHYHISSGFVFMSGVLLANALAGLGGSLVAQSSGFVDITMGFNMALFCVTSLILGKTFIGSFVSFSILIPVVGVVSYFSIQQMLLMGGFDLKYFTMIQALLVLCVLVISYRKKFARGAVKLTDHLGV